MMPAMAKVKPTGSPKRAPKRVRNAVTNVRSTPEWKAWLERYAEFKRKDLVDLIDECVLMAARADGFEMPPKR